MAKLSVDQALLKAKSHAKKSEIEEAQKLYHAVLQAFPKNKRAQQGLAALNKPKQSAATESPPQDTIDQLLNLYNKGQFEVVVEQAQALTEQYPEAFIVWNLLGAAAAQTGLMGKAIAAFQRVIAIKPDYADAYNNLGNTLKDQGNLDEAIVSFNKALSLKPDHAEAYNNMGNALKDQGKLGEAIVSFSKALSLKPDYADAYNNMGNALQDQGKLDEAIASYNKALSLKPNYTIAHSQKLQQQAHICDWSSMEADSSLIEDLGIIGKAVTPFSMLLFEDAPGRHRLRSANFAKEKFPFVRDVGFSRHADKPKRLKVGYCSADFHHHATMYLMAQIFEQHDKENFEIYAYSYGPDKQDEMRKRLIESVGVFHDVREMSDMQIVGLARSAQLDIAIDLKGFTKGARLAPFAYGLAPVQISYLGYPGTLGADFIDYIVADPIVIPEDQRQHYSEKIIYLPHTYQPTDNKRVISTKVITREDLGLPNDGFVFCCFNNNHKISPREFEIWMRLLQKVAGSVLWLLKSNEWAEQNLKREAEARGVSSGRLIFAEKLPQAEHLARLKLADLFLDTFNYNAHTTTSDALWAGLPVVTKIGEGFAARVAGSLLKAIGLSELITETEEQYETLALEFASNPKKLAQIKEKLAANRLSAPLFNTEQYTRHLENGYQQAYQRYFDGKHPDTITVPR